MVPPESTVDEEPATRGRDWGDGLKRVGTSWRPRLTDEKWGVHFNVGLSPRRLAQAEGAATPRTHGFASTFSIR